MIEFLLGALFGGAVGLLTACLCVTAGHSDRELYCKDLDDISSSAAKEGEASDSEK